MQSFTLSFAFLLIALLSLNIVIIHSFSVNLSNKYIDADNNNIFQHCNNDDVRFSKKKEEVRVDDAQLLASIKRYGNNWNQALKLLEEQLRYNSSYETPLLSGSIDRTGGDKNMDFAYINYKRSLSYVLQLLGKNGAWEAAYDLYCIAHEEIRVMIGNHDINQDNDFEKIYMVETEICRCAISALGASGKSDKACDVLYQFVNDIHRSNKLEFIRSMSVLYTSTIAACRKSGDWEKALQLWNEAESSIPNTTLALSSFQRTRKTGYEAVLTVLARNKRYREAIDLIQKQIFSSDGIRSIVIDINMCNLVLLACSKASNHTAALSFLDSMMRSDINNTKYPFPNTSSLGKRDLSFILWLV